MSTFYVQLSNLISICYILPTFVQIQHKAVKILHKSIYILHRSVKILHKSV